MMAQLCRDFLVHAEADGQAIFNALGADEKELLGLRNPASVSTLTTISVSILNGCSAGSPSTCDRRWLNHALEPGLGGRGAWHQSGAEGAVHRCDVRRRARRRYPDFYQSAFSGVDPNDFTQLCPYLRRKNPARDSFRGSVRFPASRRKTCSAKLLGEANLQRSRRRPRTHCLDFNAEPTCLKASENREMSIGLPKCSLLGLTAEGND
jgi:hypothetical protein